MINFAMIIYTLGWLLLFEGAFLAVPLITAAIYWESAFFAFFGYSHYIPRFHSNSSFFFWKNLAFVLVFLRCLCVAATAS